MFKYDTTLFFIDFLRSNITDPRGRISFEKINSFTGDGILDIFTVYADKKVSHIDTVTIGGIEQDKYKVWVYDNKTRSLIFFNPPTGDIECRVYTGNNWIFHDRPIRSTMFPRIVLRAVDKIGETLGNDTSNIITSYRFQINIYSQKDSLYLVPYLNNLNSNLSGQELSNRISELIYDEFKEQRSIFYPFYVNYVNTDRGILEGLDSQLLAFSTRQEFTIRELNNATYDVDN